MCRLLILLLLLSASASAQTRYAVLVGADTGAADQVGLRYAERDAARVAEVLARFGQVPEENLVLLRGRTAADVERVMARLSVRIRADKAAGREALLLFFYSGHADANALQLGATQLSLTRLKALVDATEAHLRVMVVDACRSGELTRLKGATPAEPFNIEADDRLASEGLAIITSGAAGEDAQESDLVQGGIFTHHLIAGLRGAADTSNDQRITLDEVYRYVYEQTLRSTSRARFVQHPTFSFRMRGRNALVLTRLTETQGLGRLRLAQAGRYLLLPQTGNGRVAELTANDSGTLGVLLEPGRWLVRRRTDAAVFEAHTAVRAGATTTLRTLTRVPYGRTVRRGHALKRRTALQAITGGGVAGAFQAGFGPSLVATAGARLDLAPLSLALRLRWGHASAENTELSITQDTLGLDLGVLKLFDLGVRTATGFGLRLGADAVNQRFETLGQSPDRWSLAGRVSPIVRFEWAPTARITVGLEAGLDVLLARTQGEDDLRLATAPTAGLSIGVYLP